MRRPEASSRRRAFTLALALCVVLVVSTLTWAATTVTFWHALGSDHQAVVDRLVAEFNAQHPDIVVRAEYQGNYGALQEKLVAAVAAGRAPTLSLVYNNWTAAFYEADRLTPIASFVSDPEIGLTAEEQNDYLPAFVEANSWDGQWVTMPFNKSIYVLYYNKALLDEAGVSVPKTMEEFRLAAKAVSEKTRAKGFALKADNDLFGVFLHAFGGSWLADGKSAFNGPEGVAALQLLQDMVHVDKSAYYHDGWLDEEFNRGNTAMFIHTVGTIPWISKDLDWGTAPIPVGATQTSVVQGTDLAIFNQASEAEQRAAWRFVKWITSPEVNAEFAVATGYLPVRQSAIETDTYQAHIASAPEKYQAGVSQLATASFDPGVSAWSDARMFVTDAVQEALILGTSPKAALDRAAASTNRSLGD